TAVMCGPAIGRPGTPSGYGGDGATSLCATAGSGVAPGPSPASRPACSPAATRAMGWVDNMAQFATNFSEYPNDLRPSDWSQPWSGGSYVVRAQPSPIPGGKLLRKETGSFHDVILWDTVGVAAEAEFLALVRFVSGQNIHAAGSLRAQPPGRTHIEPGIVFGTEARIFLL